MFDLNAEIQRWTDRLRKTGALANADIVELESHLRDEVDSLKGRGLSEDEAYIIAVKRIGESDQLSDEYTKVNDTPLWKQLAFRDTDEKRERRLMMDVLFVGVLCLLAGTAAKLPELLGIPLVEGTLEDLNFYARNFSFFVLPFIAFFFIVRRGSDKATAIAVAAAFIISIVAINIFPSFAPHHTLVLSAIHLPILLWMVIGVAYGGQTWRQDKTRMDFVRYSGEAFIYGVLVLCGVLVLMFFTLQIFSEIKLDISRFYNSYVFVYLGVSVPIVAVYLVEAKKSIVENIAPILAKIFNPLFLITMLSFLGAVMFLGKNPYADREFLLTFNLMLILVLGLVVYIVSARRGEESVGVFDYLNLLLILVAVIIDLIALSAIIFRITSYGVSPNKATVLGANLILLVNLAGLMYHYARFVFGGRDFRIMEHWQTFYFYAYALWTAVVAFVFPAVFGFK